MDKKKKVSEKQVFEYLDDLRESGSINMFGAVPYIQEEFNVDRDQASKLLSRWMETFNIRHKED